MVENTFATLDELAQYLVQQGGSDLYLEDNGRAVIRVAGELAPLEGMILAGEEMDRLWTCLGAGPETQDADGTFTSSDGFRFRVNLLRFLQRRRAVLRHVKADIPDLDSLGLPTDLLREWATRKGGLILVCGPTASGKSTTIAATLRWVAEHWPRHIVTIEDPVEYLFSDSVAFFSQREVGVDTESFAHGLRQALRQAPDIIFVGEIRDTDSATTALRATEVGHTVLTTLHSASCPEALERLIRLFPEGEREGIAALLANQLTGMICQRLLPGIGGGVVAAVEHLQNQGLSRRLIQERKWHELTDLLNRGGDPSNRSMLNHLAELCQQGRIELATAARALPNPQDLYRALRGISSI